MERYARAHDFPAPENRSLEGVVEGEKFAGRVIRGAMCFAPGPRKVVDIESERSLK